MRAVKRKSRSSKRLGAGGRKIGSSFSDGDSGAVIGSSGNDGIMLVKEKAETGLKRVQKRGDGVC